MVTVPPPKKLVLPAPVQVMVLVNAPEPPSASNTLNSPASIVTVHCKPLELVEHWAEMKKSPEYAFEALRSRQPLSPY